MSDPTKPNRHGKRAPGQVALSITLPKRLKDHLAKMASDDHRTLAAFVRMSLAAMARRSEAATRGAAERAAA